MRQHGTRRRPTAGQAYLLAGQSSPQIIKIKSPFKLFLYVPDACRVMDELKSLIEMATLLSTIGNALERRSVLRFTDTAVNLLDETFSGTYNGKALHPSDFDAILLRASLAGVHRIIITGTDLADSRRALALARTINSSGRFPGLHLNSTVGVHPTCTSGVQGSVEKLESDLLELARDGMSDSTVVFIGECGLDFDRLNFSDEATQRKFFPLHLRVARATGLPLFLHDRATRGGLLECMEKEGGPFYGVVHSFTGSAQDLQGILNHENLFVGLNGCGLKTTENCAVAAQIPLQRLVLETDAPWCSIKPSSPVFPYVTPPGKAVKKEKWEAGALVKERNEPCLVLQVAEAYAKLTGLSLETISKTTEENVLTLLK